MMSHKKQIQCPICQQVIKQDICIVDCPGRHVFHYTCIVDSITHFKKECPTDRHHLTNCIHDNQIKALPQPPKQQEIAQELDQSFQAFQAPCYICGYTTRPGLLNDQVIECSSCQNAHCHASCESEHTGKNFDYSYRWFCADCTQSRRTVSLRARRQR